MKILYYYSKLNIGGAERSTIRLLNSFVNSGHDVTILLRWDCGTIENLLDERIHKIYLKRSVKSKGKFGKIINALIQHALSFFRLRLLKEEFDICISGLFGYNPKDLFKHIHAKQYYQLLRNDVRLTGKYGKTEQYMYRYGDRFDAYIGVSKYTTDSFKETYPLLKGKAYTIYNILPSMSIDESIRNPYLKTDKLKILTVCRLSEKAKGLLRMTDVCLYMKQKGYQFIWYIVGDGNDKNLLLQRINEYKLEDQMILLGEQQNVSAYYKYCDLVAVLSYYEGLCGVVNESKLMNKPLIATEFSGIYEQIRNLENGLIVGNDLGSIKKGFDLLLNNNELLKKFAVNQMPDELLDNELKIRQYEELFLKIEKEKNNA